MSMTEYSGRGKRLARRFLPLPLRKVLWAVRHGVPLGGVVRESLTDLKKWLYRKLPDRYIQQMTFRRGFGRPLNFEAPETFNEKIHWLMLNYRDPEMTLLADKYAARARVAARAGADILNELYGVWDDPLAVPFEDLPESFVLKVTSGFKQNIFCPDKSELDYESTRRQLAAWMRHNEYWEGREWAYKDIRPRIVAERFLRDERGNSPADYKIFCFGGEPQFVQVDVDRFTNHRRALFDLEWKRLPFDLEFPPAEREPPKPANFERMLSTARSLSRGFPFARVDLYSIGESVLFGEMTWYPGGGFDRFIPDSYDRQVGRFLTLPPPLRPGSGLERPPRRIAGVRVAWTAAALFATGLTGLLVSNAFVSKPIRTATRVHVPAPEGEFLSAALAVSPDGRSIAFTTSGPKPSLYVHSLLSGQSRRIAGATDAKYPFWSPDGRSIGFFAHGSLKRIDVEGGAPQVLCEAADPRGGAWSPTGQIVFAPSPLKGLSTVSSEARGVSAMLAPIDSARGESHEWPSFLPDGRRYLFVVRSDDPAGSGVYLGELGSSRRKQILSEPTSAVYADGHILFRRGTALLAQPFDLDREAVAGVPVSVHAKASGSEVSRVAAFAGGSSGVIAYSREADSSTRMHWIDRSGAVLVALDGSRNMTEPDLSPDGKRVVWNGPSPDGSSSDIWMADLRRGTNSRLTMHPFDDLRPVWSPDGQKIAFSSRRRGSYEVYVKTLAGDERVVLRSGGPTYVDDWSPDGRYLVYEDFDPKTLTDLWILPLVGDGKPVPFARANPNEAHAQFSPDGRWLAYVSDETGQPEVFVQPFPPTGQKWQVSNQGGVAPSWRRDGTELFYISFDQRMVAVPVTTRAGATFRAGVPRSLFSARFPHVDLASGRTPYVAEPDGQRFLVRRLIDEQAPPPIVVAVNWTAGLKD